MITRLLWKHVSAICGTLEEIHPDGTLYIRFPFKSLLEVFCPCHYQLLDATLSQLTVEAPVEIHELRNRITGNRKYVIDPLILPRLSRDETLAILAKAGVKIQ